MAAKKSRGSTRRPPGRTNAQRAAAAQRSSAAARSQTRGGRASSGQTPSGDSALRRRVADWSRGPVVFMSTLPKLLIPGLMLVLMLVGLIAPPWAAVPALLVIALFIGWLAFLSWPVLPGRQRAVRVFVIGVVLVAAIGRTAGWI